MTPSIHLTPAPRRSDWLGGLFAAAMLAILLAGWLLDVQSFAWFLWSLGITAAMTLCFLVWWFTRRPFRWGQRLLVFVAPLLMGFIVRRLTVHSITQPPFLFLWGAPILTTLWWAWFIATPRLQPKARVAGILLCMALAWTPFLLIRVPGLKGNLRADIHWRWTPTSEELYLAQLKPKSNSATTQPSRPLQLQPTDWPAFRGPNRDATARNTRISLDWSKEPPKILWKQRVGPAWSSMTVVDNHVFTQEQRGQREAVVCRDALTGNELWSHEDESRFDEPMSGPGPRATPAFADGRLFAQGATGTLACLDAATGRPIWTRDVRHDADAALPFFGFSNSPLVLNDRVIVFAGGEGKKGLLAYAATDGHPLWTADAGKISYASPQSQGDNLLMFTDEALFVLDPATGQVRGQFPVEHRVGLPASLQACAIDADTLVIGNGASFGAQRLRLTPNGGTPSRQWVTKQIHPAFSDMVYHAGFLYGFDGTVFCCIDANTGSRKWRTGHYGAGQVLLLADQAALLITTEDGQLLLLRANPDHSEELARLEVLTGKAWNHPALAGKYLFLRSDAEMACIELK